MDQKKSLDDVRTMLVDQDYIPDDSIVMSIYLSILLQKPLLIEGPAGVGKTEIAKVLSRGLNAALVRLQCYEGLDSQHAIYEWNYQRQLMYLKISEREDLSLAQREETIFGEDFLLKRPLLQAISSDQPSVLLIDEIDRADEEFESYFLELLSDWQITIPELGTQKAKHIPYVVVTSNRVRELSEALRRRCLYLWIDHPTFEKELQIVHIKNPNMNEKLANQICLFMKEVRQLKLEKHPGIAETLDWARALSSMHIEFLNKDVVESTLGLILKDWQDIRTTQDSLSELYKKVGVIQKMT